MWGLQLTFASVVMGWQVRRLALFARVQADIIRSLTPLASSCKPRCVETLSVHALNAPQGLFSKSNPL